MFDSDQQKKQVMPSSPSLRAKYYLLPLALPTKPNPPQERAINTVLFATIKKE